MNTTQNLIAEHASKPEQNNDLMTPNQKRRSGMGAVVGGLLLLGAGMTTLGVTTLTQEVPKLDTSNFVVTDEAPPVDVPDNAKLVVSVEQGGEIPAQVVIIDKSAPEQVVPVHVQ